MAPGEEETRGRPVFHGARRLWLLFCAMAALAAVVGALPAIALHRTLRTMSHFMNVYAEEALEAQRLRAANERLARLARSFLLTTDEAILRDVGDARSEVMERLDRLDQRVRSARGRALLEVVVAREQEHLDVLDRTFALQREGAGTEELGVFIERQLLPIAHNLDEAIVALSSYKESLFDAARREARETASQATIFLGLMATLGLIVAAGLAVVLLRTLQRDRQSRERLEQTNRDLDAFAGRIAHDLRNLLGPLPAMAHLLGRGELDPSGLQKMSDRLARLTDRSTLLIDGLLGFARGEQVEGPEAQVSLAEATSGVLEDLEAERRRVDAEITPELEEIRVRCSRGPMQAVLANLVGNALKYMVGRPVREVRIATFQDAAWGVFEIEDTGPGIPKEALEQVFVPFYRVPGSTGPGVGIGLATVKRIVEAHRGQIEVRSTVGEGTCIRVRLPLAH